MKKEDCKNKKYWDIFIKKYKKLIYSNIYKTYKSYYSYPTNEEVEDIYQDFFIKIINQECKNLLKFDDKKSALTTFLSVITRNVTIDNLNKKNKIYLFDKELTYIDNHEMDLEIPKNIMTDKEEIVLRLFYEKEMNAVEISKFLNLKDSTIRVIKKNALAKIKIYYKGEGYA